MPGPQWRTIDGRSWPALAEARLQAHYAVQWLARGARGFITPTPDDSHTNVGWDDGRDAFVTHALRGGARIALSLPGLTLAVLDAQASNPERLFPLRDRTDREVRAWLGDQMRALGLDPAALDAPSPWRMPTHALGNGGAYGGKALDGGLAALAAWFANANSSLQSLRQDYVERGLKASAVRCWPHHFDMATLIPLDAGGGEQARSVNVGFSPGDGTYAEPYYYVSPWPYPEANRLPRLPRLGHWHTESFLAAVAPASRIAESQNAQGETEEFLRAAIEAATTALGGVPSSRTR